MFKVNIVNFDHVIAGWVVTWEEKLSGLKEFHWNRKVTGSNLIWRSSRDRDPNALRGS